MNANNSDYNLYVSLNGSDKFNGLRPKLNNEGTEGPFFSIEKAMAFIREKKLPGSVTVWFREGRYFLDKPITFGIEDSAPVTYAAYPGERVVFDGGKQLKGFKKEIIKNKIFWIIDIPEVKDGKWYFKQLFVNGKRRRRPRLPKKGYYRIENIPDMDLESFMPDNRTDYFYSAKGDVKNWHNLNDIDILAVHYWNEERMPIASYDDSKRKVSCQRESVWPLKDDASKKFARYYVENVFEALENEGEWYLDRNSGKLYYLPMPDEKIEETEIFAPRISQLLKFEGIPKEERYVTGIKFDGITFEHTIWEQPTKEFKTHHKWIQPANRAGDHQASVSLPGIISFEGARYCAIENCEIRHGGFYGIEIGKGCMALKINNNSIHDLGAGGIKIGGSNANEPIEDRTGNNLISNNHIYDSGHVFLSAVGILVTHAFNNNISNNHIHNLYYSGISCGWIWGYGESVTKENLIENNHIHHLGTGDLNDMGGIYTLGKQPGTVIRGNIIHNIKMFNYGGWAIYLDEGSSQILIENNICYKTDSELLQQHYGRENIIRNNIFAFSKLGLVSLSRVEEHNSLTFTRNILVTKKEPVFLARNGESLDKCGFYSDLNIFYSSSGGDIISGDEYRDEESNVSLKKEYSIEDMKKLGYDLHSIIQDPFFMDLENDDYRLRNNSVAYKIGFRKI